MKPLLTSVLIGGLTASALSADDTLNLSLHSETNRLAPIVVTGTRIPSETETTPTSLTVIRREEIESKQTRGLADILRDQVGVQLSRTGQPGGQTSIFLRGANSGQTLVLIDGVRVNNPFNGGYDFANLSTDNIERIEILRGPQSTLWGSEALGGVVNVVTRRGAGEPTASLLVEGGSNDSFRTRESFSGSLGKFSLSGEGSFFTTGNDRVNSASQAWNASGRASVQIWENLDLSLLGTYLKSRAGVPNDQFTNDPNDLLKNENKLVALTLQSTPVEGWNAKLVLSHDHERIYFSQPPPNPPFFFGNYNSITKTDRDQIDQQNVITLGDTHKILVGGTFEHDFAVNDDTFSSLHRTIDNEAVYGQYDFSPGTNITVTAGGRIDHYNSFGTHGTYRFGARYTIDPVATIFRGSVGTGFRAPTVSQLYFPGFGNPALKPEENLGWDAGVEQPFLGDHLRVGATFFHNDFDNLIVGFKPRNVDRARTEGVESFVTWTPCTNVTLHAGYTWLDAIDRATGLRLQRRAEHTVNLGLSAGFLERFQASVNANFASDRPDLNYSTFPASRVQVSGYNKVDLALSCQVCRHFEIFGRVENLCDDRHADVFAFPVLGRTFWLGVSAKF